MTINKSLPYVAFVLTAIFLSTLTPHKVLAQPNNSYNWFTKGEKLHYTVKFGFLKAGEAELLYQPEEDTSKFALTARTWTKGIGAIINLKDRIRVEGSHTTTQPFLADTFELRLNESNYVANKLVTYDRQTNGTTQTIYENIHGKEAPKYFDAQPYTRDMFSSIYAIRKLVQQRGTPAKVGETITMPIWDLDSPYTLKFKIVEEVQIKTHFGWLNTIHVQPVLQKPGEQAIGNGKWHIWATNDGNYIPVKVSVDLPFGAFTGELKHHSSPPKGRSKAPKDLPLKGEINTQQPTTTKDYANPVEW